MTTKKSSLRETPHDPRYVRKRMAKIQCDVKRAQEERRFWQRMCGTGASVCGFSWKDSASISVDGDRIEINQAHLEWVRGLLEDAGRTHPRMSLKSFLNELHAAKEYRL